MSCYRHFPKTPQFATSKGDKHAQYHLVQEVKKDVDGCTSKQRTKLKQEKREIRSERRRRTNEKTLMIKRRMKMNCDPYVSAGDGGFVVTTTADIQLSVLSQCNVLVNVSAYLF